MSLAEPTPLKLHKAQAFTMRQLARSSLKNAPYNPRVIDKHARKKLKDNIGNKKIGLVEPLIWNETTGNLVGGHQRLGILDDLSDSPDYLLDVAVVRMTDKIEKTVNLSLNNQSAAGAWDADLLAQVLTDIGEIDGTGFDKIDVSFILPDFDQSPLFRAAGEQGAADVATIAKMKANKKAYREQEAVKDDAEFYIVVVFQSRDDCTGFLRAVNLDEDGKYFSGETFKTLCGIEAK